MVPGHPYVHYGPPGLRSLGGVWSDVASLRGRQIQGILDREFGKTFSLNGVYQLLKRYGFVCLEPRPRHPRQNLAVAKAFKRRAHPYVNRVRASRPRTTVRVWFQDEARFGQQGALAAVSAIEGARPSVVRQHGRKSICVFAAVEPAAGWALAMPFHDVNTATMQAFLDTAASKLRRREHAVMILDGAGWHCALKLR